MKRKINIIRIRSKMKLIDGLIDKVKEKNTKSILVRAVCIIYVFVITMIVTKYSSNILIPDLFENERITVDAYMFIPMFFMAMVLFFREKKLIRFMFVYHFVLIFTVFMVLIPYDKRPIILAPMILTLLYDKIIGLAMAMSICAYNVFTLSARPDYIVNGPEFMQVIVMLILTGTAVMIVKRSVKLYYEIILYFSVYVLSVFMQMIFGYYCQEYPGCEVFCEPSFKFKYSMGVVISLVIFAIIRNIYCVFDSGNVLQKKLTNISSSDYILLEEMKKSSVSLYKHSIEVAELSGKAAKAIGVYEDLAFAGGLYHDVGKIAGANYVHEGIKLANKYKLPHQVKDIIIEHNVKNRLPKSKEAAIVMLADTAVSAVEYLRSNKKDVDESKAFENAINTRMKSGALNDSGITVGEFVVIKDLFMNEKF